MTVPETSPETRTAPGRFRIWFPPLFLGAVALGTLPVIFANLFVPSSVAAPGVAALFGEEYARAQLAAFDANPYLIHIHAVIGFVLVAVAPFQFWKSFRNKHRQVHRVMGYVAVTCLTLLATSGVAVAIVYPFAGLAGIIPNLLWMSAILYCVGTAVARIRRRDMLGHETWMTRAIAMTLGITFASLYIPILTGVLHVPSRPALAISFWLGVGECLFVGELWLRRPGRPQPRKT